MPSYRAIANGNWSATGTWNVWSGSAWVAATVVPTTGDDVWANNFTVTINQNVTVLTLRNVLTGAPGTGTASGGFFQITTGDFTVTVTSTIINTHLWSNASSQFLIQVTATSGVTTLNVSATAPTSSSTNLRFINVSGSGCTVNINGSFLGAVGGIAMILQSNTNTINLVGDITNYNNAGGSTVIITGTNAVFNQTGNIIVQSTIAASTSVGLDITNVCTVTITGNVQVLSGGTIVGIGIRSTTSSNITVIGNILGGNGVATSIGVSLTGAGTFNHTGICQAGNGNGNGNGAVGVSSTAVGSINILSGPFVFGNYGTMPFSCTRMFLSSNTSNYIEFASNSTNGALFPSPAPTRLTMYSPNTLADTPAPANVRQGIVYALGSQTGTLIVPNPANVALGIGTDNTVGTAVLTPASVKAAVWDALLTDITTPDTIGVRLKNASTVDSTGDQIASLLNT